MKGKERKGDIGINGGGFRGSILRGRFRKVFVKKKDNSRNGKYYSTRVKLAFNPCNTSRLTICIRRSPSNWGKNRKENCEKRRK